MSPTPLTENITRLRAAGDDDSVAEAAQLERDAEKKAAPKKAPPKKRTATGAKSRAKSRRR
jgi:hypothetical protein